MNQILFSEDYKISVDRVYKIMDADYLLSPYETLLQQISDNSSILSLIKNFAELVQIFPDSPTGKIGSLLDKSLRRAVYVLNGYRAGQKTAKTYDPTWELVFFSASLLRNISKVMDYGVIVCNQDGKYVQFWHPCSEGAMTKIKDAKYYRVLPFTHV